MAGMHRRTFLRVAAGAGAFAAVSSAAPSGAAGGADETRIDRLFAGGARVMWIAAHPDDEALVGTIIARASLFHRVPVYFLVLTRGGGGECCRPEGCLPDLATVRSAEIARVAELYRAELQLEDFWNAPLPVESFPRRHEIAAKWKAQKDPAAVCAEAIRRFRPDVLFTFSPINGFTGHPEHQLASRFAATGARTAADPASQAGGLPPHRTEFTFYGLNRYWPFILFRKADPGPVTDVFRTGMGCVGGRTCAEVMADISREHRTQANDMGTVRRMKPWLDWIYLRRADPFTENFDPYEPA
jgi:LmbE family N-acetylglucosaminyl deacetylase